MRTTTNKPSLTAGGKYQADSAAAAAVARSKGWLAGNDSKHIIIRRLQLPAGTKNVLHSVVDGEEVDRHSLHFDRVCRLGLVKETKSGELYIDWRLIKGGEPK